MATEFQTSFIPKQSQQARGSGRRLSSGNFFFGFTLLVFLGVMGFTAAVLVWTKYTEKSITSLESDLKKSQEQYDRRFIEEAARLNTRIETSKRLLANHVALSGILSFLENTTTRDVSLTSLSIQKSEDGKILLSADGVALDYPAIVAQSDAYGQGSLVRDLIFEGLNANEAGQIEFSLNAVADQKLIDYSSIVAGMVQSGATAQPIQQAQTQQSQTQNQQQTQTQPQNRPATTTPAAPAQAPAQAPVTATSTTP